MNLQSHAPFQVNPQRIQQCLFVTLAVMMTLIGAQLFHQFQQRQQADQLAHFVRPAMIQATPLGVSARAEQPKHAAQTFANADQPVRSGWVF